MFVLLIVFSHLGWLHSAGFASLGQRQIWLILLIPLAYSIVTSLYAFTGNLDLHVSDPVLAGLATLFLMVHAFLEEVAFRGLVLHGFVRVWGNKNSGIFRSVLISSLIFGGITSSTWLASHS